MHSTKSKPAKRKLNVKLLRKIQKHILEEPRRLTMKYQFLSRKPGLEIEGDNDSRQEVPPCGTVACIAGWALVLTGTPIDATSAWMGYIVPKAETLLGVSYFGYISHRLFDADAWPILFRDEYRDAETPEKRAEIAAARIEHLIKTES